MITYLFGRAPNLPWWRIQYMSDAEIAAYNRSFMKEVEMRTEYAVDLQNPIKLDCTYDAHGQQVQWNGESWLLYNSPECIAFRRKCLTEFEEQRNNLKLLEMHHWNAAIEAAADLCTHKIAIEIRKLKK